MKGHVVRTVVAASLLWSLPAPPASSAADASACDGSIAHNAQAACSFAFKGFPIVMHSEFTPTTGQMTRTWDIHMETLVVVHGVVQSISNECSETGVGRLECHSEYRPVDASLPVHVPPEHSSMLCLTHLHDLARDPPVTGDYGSGAFRCSSGSQEA